MNIFQRSIVVISCALLITLGIAVHASAANKAPLLPATCGSMPTSADAWRDMFRTLPRAQDGYFSAKLPTNGRIAWVFGDTARLDKHDYIHNMLVVTCGSQIKQIGMAEAIPGKSDGSFYWGGPPIVDGGALYVFAPHVRPDAAWPYFSSIGTDLAKFDLPLRSDPVFKGLYPTPSSNTVGQTDAVQWGAGVVSYGGYVYVYGTHKPAGAWGQSVRVARVPSGKLATLSAWRYWNGTNWGTNVALAKDIIDAAVDGTDSAFTVHIELGKVIITTKKSGPFSPDVGQFSATNFTGPFTFTKLIDSPTTTDMYTYLPAAHPETGLRLITINQQAQGRPWPDDVWANPDDYRAKWLSY
ncbi:MAG: hypothetical protein AAB834_03785 [Patescibacteria group bacterium]